MDDDDDFLYGGSAEPEPVSTTPAPEPKPKPVVAAIEAETIVPDIPFGKREPSTGPITPLTPLDVKDESRNGSVVPADHGVVVQEATAMEGIVTVDAKLEIEDQEEEEEEEEEGDIEEESEDDIEFIMEPPTRSLDLRPTRPVQPRVSTATATFTPTKAPQAAGPSLTTEYTPRERGAPPKPAVTTPSAPPSISAPPSLPPGPSAEPIQPEQLKIEEGPEPSTLPPVTAPPSHPQINPDIPGTLDGRSILDVDLANMSEKLWRRPGADISDWFNYGFDELSWEAYCYRRREISDVSSMLKTNVLNFAGMPEDQLSQLPPEIRTMVIAGATAMMAGGGGGQMMPGMNPMMGGDMNMPPMMGPMMVGMGGEMGMDGAQAGMVQNVPPEQGMEQYGPQPGMPPMGMPGEYGMQDPNAMQQGLYPGMEGPVAPTPVPVGAVSRGGGTPNAFRGRGMGPGMMRGARGGFAGRGRGHANVPIRPASPLPPNVPTGPRNANKYKDRDNNAPAVEGLDYGGGAQDRSSGTPVGDHEDRAGRKRRDRSPGDDRRETKRR